MTLVILVRHAHSTANAERVLAGRSEGIHLTPEGRKQARGLAKRLGPIGIKTLRSSPLIRCQETIEPWLLSFKLHSQFGTPPKYREDEGLTEVDYGTWTGEKLRKLSRTPLWITIQKTPSRVTFPKGESLANVQNRAMSSVEEAVRSRGKGAVMIISHGDVLKSIVAASLNLHLDEFQRIVIDPASISVLHFSSGGTKILLLNDSQSKIAQYLPSSDLRGTLVGGGEGTMRGKK